MPDPSPSPKSKQSFAAPTGTRDLYPLELARRRWIEEKWRTVAVRHGFEEIDGPTFEHTELYTAKSGEGIVSEIFGTFSGKDEAAVKEMGERLSRGEKAGAPFALRPEFTPTLARMYAARAAQLPKPCKWFWQGPCFRAERPQRGRLREFWQWNCDVLGIPSLTGESGVDQAAADAELLFVCASLLESIGLTPTDARIRVSDRRLLAQLLSASGVNPSFHDKAFAFLDRRAKMAPDKWQTEADAIGLDLTRYDAFSGELRRFFDDEHVLDAGLFGVRSQRTQGIAFDWRPFQQWSKSIRSNGLGDWLTLDLGIVRGLAYYTGMVFEVIVDGERAVAGGGRYDNLIETFGGPPTPAVGFGMGDVVLSLVLQDKGLMPSDRQIAADLGLRPDVFVISNGQPESDDAVGPMLAALRRKGMHARRSYKTTKNIGKLLQDAAACNARFAVIIESPTEVTLKNMDDNTQEKGPADELLKRVTPPAR